MLEGIRGGRELNETGYRIRKGDQQRWDKRLDGGLPPERIDGANWTLPEELRNGGLPAEKVCF